MTTSEPESILDGGWIHDMNLRPLCEAVAEFAGYDFGDSDWQAVETALPATDVEADTWYDYPIPGRLPLTLFVAADPDAYVVFVRIAGVTDERARAQIEAALFIFASWELARPPR
ncbi:hypothetical protein HLK59_45495 [Streptomyces sp. S3(2020)]|uniref:hypothetical protein n=1 Tax=Streptomyces sp. S3(2020) TaxID=2732044 RepID=UPI001487D091|nr:hypothetical protein [Streptomyces sp. S3(2020)]NNN37465.1 hypothetical protein [Streptomyces sp. S3(2020)]